MTIPQAIALLALAVGIALVWLYRRPFWCMLAHSPRWTSPDPDQWECPVCKTKWGHDN